MERLLLIDDDAELCRLLEEYLIMEGFELECAHDGESGLLKALSGEYGLVILDVMLPEQSGFQVLNHLKDRSSTPVIMLTACGDVVDRIGGLEMGSDDYLPKPFNPRELAARIRAVLRRSRIKQEDHGAMRMSHTIRVGDIELDTKTRVATRADEPVDLTTVEFDILKALMLNSGTIVSREELTFLGLGRTLSHQDRSIDVHISKLRKKLGRGISGTERIKTVRGLGYLFAHQH